VSNPEYLSSFFRFIYVSSAPSVNVATARAPYSYHNASHLSIFLHEENMSVGLGFLLNKIRYKNQL